MSCEHADEDLGVGIYESFAEWITVEVLYYDDVAVLKAMVSTSLSNIHAPPDFRSRPSPFFNVTIAPIIYVSFLCTAVGRHFSLSVFEFCGFILPYVDK
mgnify:FL=1